jgi:hypothetical protein
MMRHQPLQRQRNVWPWNMAPHSRPASQTMASPASWVIVEPSEDAADWLPLIAATSLRARRAVRHRDEVCRRHRLVPASQELGCQVEGLEEMTLHVRRHDQNMTRDKSLVDRNAVRLLTRSLDQPGWLTGESAQRK